MPLYYGRDDDDSDASDKSIDIVGSYASRFMERRRKRKRLPSSS